MSHQVEDEGSASFLTSESSENELPESSPDGRYLRVSSTQLHDLMDSFQNITIHRAVDREEGYEVSWVSIPLAMTPAHIDLFLEDLNLIAQLQHPNLMHCHTKWLESNADGRTLVLITDLIPGNTLRLHLKKIKQPRLKRVRVWASQLLSVLDYLHTRNPPRIHGDLTPEKVYVVSRTGDLKVGGLGLGTCFRHNTVSRPVNEFTAPDSSSSLLNPSIDIYSFGMCLLEICTSEKPYKCCQSPAEVTQRASNGVLPLGLSRIDDAEIRSLITLSISPQEMRPSAASLLTHSFFTLSSDDEGLKQPVKLRAVPAFESWEEPKISEMMSPSRKVDVCISVPIKGSEEQHKVCFEFDIERDTPQSIASEMVHELDLPNGMERDIVDKIISQLGDKYHPRKGTEESTEKYNSPSDRSSVDSIEMSPRQPYIRRHRKFSRLESEATREAMASSKSSRESFGTPEVRKKEPNTPMISLKIAIDQENEESDVRMVQAALNLTMNLKIAVDGRFTRQTADSVRRYQENIGHIVTGIVTPQLWDILISNSYAAQYESEIQTETPTSVGPLQRQDSHRNSIERLNFWQEQLFKNPVDN